MRGTPDISMSAAVNGAAWVYTSFDGLSVGWHLVGGTSEATPIFSGIVALANQVAHHRLGLINPGLYLLGALSQHGSHGTGIVDVTSGNNSFARSYRLQRQDRLRPGQRLGHDRRGSSSFRRSRASADRRTQPATDGAGPGTPGPAPSCLG